MRHVNAPPAPDCLPPLREEVLRAQPGISLHAVIGTIRRRKRLILATVLLVCGLAAMAAMLIRPQYTAVATLMIDQADPRGLLGGTGGGPPAGPEADPYLIPTQINLLRSPPLAQDVIKALALAEEGELRPQAPLVVRLREWLPDWSVGPTVAGWLPAPPPAETLPDAQSVVPAFLDRLSVSQQRESRIVAVSYRSEDPVLAARVANAVVQHYLDSQVAAEMRSVERARRLVRQRLEEADRRLQEAELAATDHMLAHGLPRADNLSAPDDQQAASLRRELAAARADRAVKEGRLAQVREIEASGGSYEFLSLVAGSLVIQGLKQQVATLRAQEAEAAAIYGARHPALQQMRAQRESIDRRIAEETRTIIGEVVEDAHQAGLREAELQQALRESIKDYVVSESALIRLTELSRVVDTRSAAYRGLLARLQEIDEQGGAVQPQAQVVAAATPPQKRDFPRPGAMLAAGFVSSLVLALGFAALAEHLDRGLHAAQDVERALGLPTLALVPRVQPGKRHGQPHDHVLHRPQSAYVEAIRALSLGIRRTLPGSTKVLLVTSSCPSEGKTTLAISLAALAARAGSRAIVVDLDLRHPSVAQRLRLPIHPGVVDYVQRQASLEEVVQSVPEESRLHVIAAQGLEPVADPAAILTSRRLEELINRLRLHYDIVVLDVPPSLGITDAQTAGLLADAALYVVRWGSTNEAAAANGLAALERAGISVVGCALTQVDLQQHVLYGYNDSGAFYRTYRGYFPQ